MKLKEVLSSFQPQNDGWHELQVIETNTLKPLMCALKYKGGMPIELTDCGNFQLNEDTLLAQATKYAGIELSYHCIRSQRWRKTSILKLFSNKLDRNWETARIYSKGCHRCSQDIGLHQCVLSNDVIVWLCDKCLAEMKKGAL